MKMCFLYRRMISRRLNARKPLSGLVLRHTCRCSDCRDFHGRSVMIGQRLMAEAEPVEQAGASAALRERILNATVRVPVQRPVYQPVRRPAWGMALAAVACLVLAAGVLTFMQREGDRGRPATVAVEHRQPAPVAPPTDYDAVVDEFRDTWQRLPESPVSGELDSLKTDSLTAADFLVSCISLPF